ncbi:3-beta hydroxysteroid dehydrogenase/isomerase family-domain-containing protein [Hygrophoropsis aurantiaca]|uniref:3-beta hydroxysteroid dehydrogenase/isomerase family-domain-containing protein n=1 Tax=Hygrophoropsis aurantiaca TaxID=72124 RepID=A0ACB8ABG2_9AGAM|nr:3-beta hydroxysteroid dehydrogenase/isomerase family-domain-containing protein [Hygrophoropsis aurantiaca]
MLVLLGILAVFSFIFYLYGRFNDEKLCQLPPEAKSFSPERFTPELVCKAAQRFSESPVTVNNVLPPKTGRLYIVVGGAGFLGGWIVIQLLQRGEDPRRIRILDIRPPTRPDLKTGDAQKVAFFQVDISDQKAVSDAFQAPWPTSQNGTVPDSEEITVFHTAANIRFYERHIALLPRSSKVNCDGTRNVIDAARSIGVTALIYTSSGSISVRRSRFWLWPWETQPQYFVQVLNDDDNLIPKRHDDFFSNYAASKVLGERTVRAADKSSSGGKLLRTGCIRPGNGVFGPGGDILCGAYLVRKHNPTWVGHTLQSFVYVENCALSHLCYEQRLIELERGSTYPDIGGQAFTITDTGPPVTFGDVHVALNTLDSETVFPTFSTTAMLLVSQIIEALYLSRIFLLQSSSFFNRVIARLIPNITGDIVNLQPPLFALTSVHLIFDDSRARLPPSQGGLGYNGPFTSLTGLCKTADEYFKAGRNGEERSQAGGISFGFGLIRASRGVDKMQKKVNEQLHVETVDVLN